MSALSACTKALAASGGMKAVIDGNADAISQAKAAGGEVKPFDDDVQDNVGEYSQDLIKQAVSDGKLSEENVDAIAEATNRQQRAVEDLGYVDDGETRSPIRPMADASTIIMAGAPRRSKALLVPPAPQNEVAGRRSTRTTQRAARRL